MILPDFLLLLGCLLAGLSVFMAVQALIGGESQLGPLSWASGEAPKESRSAIIRLARPLLHRIILPLIARYKLKNYRERIKREINMAGLGAELNQDEFVGLQVLLGILLPLFILTSNLLFNLNYPWWLSVLFGLFGFFFPPLYVRSALKDRRLQVLVDLPFVVDLLALATEANLDFLGAIQRVAEKMTGGPLAEELGQVLRDLKLGSSRSEALNALSWRLNMPEITSFVAVLVTVDSQGGSIGAVLRQQAEQMRQERFMRAEKAGAEASQKIYFPLIIFILPAVFIMVMGPLILQFMGGGV